jgi:hypothetical protein
MALDELELGEGTVGILGEERAARLDGRGDITHA